MKHLDTSKRELVEKHGGKPEKGPQGREMLRVPDEKIKAYQKELDELLEIETTIEIQKIPFECIEAVKDMSLMDMSILNEFVEEPKEEKKSLTKGK